MTSLTPVAGPPRPGRFVIRLGNNTGDPLAAEPIAAAMLPPHPATGRVFTLHAVTAGSGGAEYARPSGRATLSYDAAAQTLTVTVTAHGLNPGPHAAHIHLGSCQNQGPVKYMLADLTADNQGDIINQTRTVAGVPNISTAGGWYLNLHQGGMDQILADGTPTLFFRPLLCTNISSIATATARSMPAPSSSSSPSAPAMTATPALPAPTSPSAPISTGPSTMPTSPTPSGSSTASSSPVDQPTHW